MGQGHGAIGQWRCLEVCYQAMTPKRTHFPRTTAAQRRLLFETWEATGSIEEACRKAHVGQRTFYNWKARFAVEGYAGLAEFAQAIWERRQPAITVSDGRLVRKVLDAFITSERAGQPVRIG